MHDVANCVLFLASDEARHITGEELVVDRLLANRIYTADGTLHTDLAAVIVLRHPIVEDTRDRRTQRRRRRSRPERFG